MNSPNITKRRNGRYIKIGYIEKHKGKEIEQSQKETCLHMRKLHIVNHDMMNVVSIRKKKDFGA